MIQLDIFQPVDIRDAKQAIKATLEVESPLREIRILISLWHDYTWEEIESGLKSLVHSGEIIIAGTWRGQSPESWTENIYALAEELEIAA